MSNLATTASHIYSQKPTLSQNLQTQPLLLSRYLLNLHKVHATILLVLESLDRFQSLRRRRRRREEIQTQKNNGVQERKRFSPCSGCNCDKKLLNSKAGEQQQWAATTYHDISPKDSIIEILWNHPSKDHNKENIAYEEHKRFVSTQHEGGTILSNLQAKFHQCRYECTLRLRTRLSSSASEASASLPNLGFWWSLWVENSQKNLGISSL